MCDAVPITPMIDDRAGDRCGQMLPLIGNARPRSATRAGGSDHEMVIDRAGECLSARNPTPVHGTAIAPQSSATPCTIHPYDFDPPAPAAPAAPEPGSGRARR